MNKDIAFSKLLQENKHGQHIQIAPLTGFRTGTTRYRQVSFLLGKNPKQESHLNGQLPGNAFPLKSLQNSAMNFLTDGFAGESG